MSTLSLTHPSLIINTTHQHTPPNTPPQPLPLTPVTSPTVSPIHIPKKRGRKPNGGKLITKPQELPTINAFQPLVILHLKCKLLDLDINTINKNNTTYEPYINEHITYNTNINKEVNLLLSNNPTTINNNQDISVENDPITVINHKLHELEFNLHTNNIHDKKAACFYCTYSFENTQCYIPKYFVNNGYKVYGCFCSPECATSFLFNEPIDRSVKFERYAMLNHIYRSSSSSASSDNTTIQNIKPAPNPYYMLDKFYGNLTIQEYRSLFNKDRFFVIVDKPLTRVLPELYEDNIHVIHSKILNSSASSSSSSSSSSVKNKRKDTNNQVSKSYVF